MRRPDQESLMVLFTILPLVVPPSGGSFVRRVARYDSNLHQVAPACWLEQQAMTSDFT
jgi:hypothetical protein